MLNTKASRSNDPHLNIFRTVLRAQTVGGVHREEYVLHITESAWRAIGEPQYVRIAVNVKSQKIRLTAQEGRDKQAKKIVLRQGGHGYKIGTVKRFIDVGMRTGRYFYEGNNVFRHE